MSMQCSQRTGSGGPLRGVFLAVCLLAALWAGGAGAPVAMAQNTYTVTSLDDTDEEDEGTFRWAVQQVNDDTDAGLDTILFSTSLIGLEDSDFVIELELNSPLQTITREVQIIAPNEGGGTDPEIFVDIFYDPSEGEELTVNETLILRNVQLRSNALVFVGGENSDPAGLIDVVWDIGDFQRDITWPLSDRNTGEGLEVVEPGRVVKTGHGELALLAPQGAFGTYSGGALLVDGVLRTDSRSLEGDIQLCTADAGNGFAASADCASALLVFEMPSVAQDPNVERSDPPTNGTYAGNITDGAGVSGARVVKTGEGTLTLTGTNTYAGDTFVMGGELRGDLTSIPSSTIHICPGVANISKPAYEDPTRAGPEDIECDPVEPAELTLDIESNTALGATLLGQGHLNKAGSARLTLGDQSGFDGVVNVREGELRVDDQLGTTGSSEVEVEVRDGGTLEFEATGTVHGEIDVRDGGEMRGDGGTVEGDVRIRNGGRIRDALTINGDLDLEGELDVTTDTTQAETARLDDDASIVIDTRLGAAGTGVLIVTDTLTLREGAIEPEFGTIDPANPPDPAFLVAEVDAGGTLDGQLSGGENDDGILFSNALFDLSLLYGATPCAGTLGGQEVCLLVTFDPVLIDDADTKNQRAIAGALDQAYLCAQDPNAPGCGIEQALADDFNEVYGNFAVPSDEMPDILDQLMGDEYAAVADIRSAGVARFNRSVTRRFDLEMLGLKADALAPGSPSAALPSVSTGGVRWLALGGGARSMSEQRGRRMPWRRDPAPEPMPINRHAGAGGITAWLDMHGVFGELDGGKQADDIDYRIYGPLFGLDYGVTENIVVGLTLGYTRNELDTPGDRTTGSGDSYQGGAYVGALFDAFYFTGAFRYGYTDFETRRRIRFGDLRRTARADFDARDISAFAEAAYKLPSTRFMPIPEKVAVQPFLSVAYAALDQSSFNESNAGSLNLRVDSQDLDALHTNLGVRIALFGHDSDNRYMLPQLRISYEREWLDPDRPLDATLPAAGEGGRFEIDGAELPKDRAVLGLTSEAGVSDRINLFADYDLRVAPDLIEHSLALGLRALF